MEKQQLLDHGYLGLVEAWGSDQAIIEAARMSTDKGFLGWEPRVTGICCLPNGEPMPGGQREVLPPYLVEVWNKNGRPSYQDATNPYRDVKEEPGDEKLLKFLYDNKHSTPFEMGGLTIEVQAPIFVFREWHRHRVPFGYSEMSARYVPMPDFNYIPTVERLLINSKTNKQAGVVKGALELTAEMAAEYRVLLEGEYKQQERLYQVALSMGVPKELARIHLPVGRYSRMRATGNLRGWLGFMALRSAPGAQYEIRVYSDAIGEIIKAKFPRTWKLFSEERA